MRKLCRWGMSVSLHATFDPSMRVDHDGDALCMALLGARHELPHAAHVVDGIMFWTGIPHKVLRARSSLLSWRRACTRDGRTGVSGLSRTTKNKILFGCGLIESHKAWQT